MKIVTAEQIRQIDRECIEGGMPQSTLMENAGKAVAEETRSALGPMNRQNILCLVGAGNNGGDGLVAARYLHEWGAKVSVYLCSQRKADDENLKLAREHNITCIEADDDKNLKKYNDLLAKATCVIDALLGTGRMRPLEGIFKQVLEKANAIKAKRKLTMVAVDLPSGMDANTGAIDPACPQADVTVTLALPKLGHYSFPGAERVGRLKIADIGIPRSLASSVMTELLTADWAREKLPARPLNANKGTFGKALVIAGSVNYIGSAYLACSGAMRVGAGLVTLAIAASLQPIVASKLTEATYLPLPESPTGHISAEAVEIIMQNHSQYKALLIGCGLGQSPSTTECIASLLSEKRLPALVLDADALNTLSQTPEWWKLFPGDAILTPHPGEMSRLCGLSIDEIQSDRIGIARKYAAAWNKTIVLKGGYTIVAGPDGYCRVSPYAHPGVATAGSGDVLAGVITGMAAQGLPLADAAGLGVRVGGEASEIVSNLLGDAGIIASDLLTALPVAIKQLKNATTGVES
ncbi:MAG: NAD(P)H-hydrate dehydratase [Dehalococcoidales bacterium]|nr:NAD(P)H-hydrate dehydratase [Dehalococcoidales bacterium]